MSSLSNIYGRISIHANEDAEHEAVVDLLVLMMFADGRVNEGEAAEIATIAADYGWENERFSVQQYFGTSVAKVREAHEAGSIEAFLDDVDQRIVNTVLRSAVQAEAQAVADADRERAPQEIDLLARIAKRFP